MKILSTSRALHSNLIRLIKGYSNIAFGVAWASASTDPYRLLKENKKNVVAGVIGIHFYQTHPDVLDDFAGSKTVKFVLQPKGVFHPKVYLFWSKTKWEAVIGSANFTAGAMGENTELGILLSQDDGNHFEELRALIDGYAQEARTLTKAEAANYRSLWKAKQPELRKITDQYGDKEFTKPAVESRILSLDWPAFLAEVQKGKNHDFDERLQLLEKIQAAFHSTPCFKDMNPQVRRAIAGIPNTAIENSAWFGSMIGAGVFKNLVIENPDQLSAALEEIPQEGTVTKAQYDAYVEAYVAAYPNGRDGIGTATRLLSMKRPDQFLCVNVANLKSLANDIGRRNKTTITYEQYWDEIVALTMDAPWWKSPAPQSGPARQAWNARAAMLDAIFYVPI